MDSPESPQIGDNDEEEETGNQEKEYEEEEEDSDKSVESEHQINENVSVWIKQFKVNFYDFADVILSFCH